MYNEKVVRTFSEKDLIMSITLCSPSPGTSGPRTHTGTHTGTHRGTHTGTHRGTHTGTHRGPHRGTQTGQKEKIRDRKQ